MYDKLAEPGEPKIVFGGDAEFVFLDFRVIFKATIRKSFEMFTFFYHLC